MTEDYSPELGCSKDELLEMLLSQGLARKVKKRIGSKVYEVLAIDSRLLDGPKQ